MRAKKVLVSGQLIAELLGFLDPNESCMVTYKRGEMYEVKFEDSQVFDECSWNYPIEILE